MLLFALFLAFALLLVPLLQSSSAHPTPTKRLPIYRHKNNSAPCSSYVFVCVSSVCGIVFLRYNLVATSCGPNKWRDVHSACRTDELMPWRAIGPKHVKKPSWLRSALCFWTLSVGWCQPPSFEFIVSSGWVHGCIGCEARSSDAWDSPDSFWEGRLNMLKSGNLSISSAVIFSACMWVLQCPTWFIFWQNASTKLALNDPPIFAHSWVVGWYPGKCVSNVEWFELNVRVI